MDPLRRFFTDTDLAAVRAAVQEAEARTSGEIVPYVVEASDEYPTAAWKGAAWGALFAPVAALALYWWGGFWGTHLPYWMLLPPTAGAAAGYLLTALVPALKRWMAGEELLEVRSRRRAEVAFLEQEVFRTRDRTGILLFVSLFEHRVVVLADSGIHQKVVPGEWDGIVAGVIQGIRAGRPGAALIAAIRECGQVLERHGVARRPDDVDELPNELRRERPE
jgi:putative membrane protein